MRSPNQYKHVHIDGTLPYELVALECALAAFVMSMEEEATGLETRANASLDRLTDKVRPLKQPYLYDKVDGTTPPLRCSFQVLPTFKLV